MANRIALYEAALKEVGTQAQAVARANDLLNFAMHGDWTIVKFFTNAVPFLNARLQGLYKLWHAADIELNPAKALRTRRLMTAKVAYHGLQIALASVALEAAGIGERFWHVRLPKPFEVEMIFGTAIEC